MRYRFIALITLAILIAQPIMITSQLNFEIRNTVDQPMANGVLSQDVGTRLLPEEHTNHVPILIDGDADFEIQGWPGEGTSEDPYLISALNITYDVGLSLIRIYNTDAHFIIRDCFLNIGNTQLVIDLENVTNAVIEYVSILCYVGIQLNNVADSSLSHVNLTGDDSENLMMYYCDNVDILSNVFKGRGISISYSSGITATNNEVLDASSVGVYIHQANGTIFESNIIHDAGSQGLYIDNSSHCWIQSNLVNESSGVGVYLRESENTTIWDNEILYSGSNGIDFVSYEWISIAGNLVNNTSGFPIHSGSAANGLVANNTLVNSPNYYAIAFDSTGFENFTITDNYFDNVYGGFGTFGGRWFDIYRNHGENIVSGIFARLFLLQDALDSNVINNSLSSSTGQGIYSLNAHRTNIIGNLLNQSGDTGIEVNGINMTIHNNTIIGSTYGIKVLSSSTNAELMYNDIKTCSIAIETNAVDTTIDSNEILDSANGILCQDTANRAQVTNNVIDGANGAGITIKATNNTVIGNTLTNSDNAISVNTADGFEIRDNTIDNATNSIYFYQSLDGEVEDNNMTECGVYFNPGTSIAQLNHTFSNNYVNDKPLYYGFEDHSESLTGDTYGQIILVNCSDNVINGGLISSSSVAIQLFYSDRADITGIGIMNQNTGISIEYSDNVTISDSFFSAHIGDEAISVDASLGFTANNITMSNIYAGIHISSSNNCSIIDSDFDSIDGFAIKVNSHFYGLFQGNTIFNVTDGIEISNVVSSIIDNNEISFSERAIYAWDTSDDNNVTFNNLHQNGYGIQMDDCFTWFIYNNTIRWNGYGIYMTNTNDDARVYNNTIALSIDSNGFCDGADFWDDWVDGGNYWNDYSGTGTYPIPGGTAIDRYPLQYTVTEPIINTPLDMSFAEGSEGNFIVWYPFDNALKEWIVDVDGTEFASGIWNFENISVNLDSLPYGTHTVFIEVFDVDMNTVNDTVIVHVYDDTPPEIDGPVNQWLFVDATGQTLSWEVEDLNPDYYNLTVDEAEFDTGSWSSGILTINVDDIDEGEHTLVLTIYDIDGNSASDTVLIRVINDDENPVIEDPEDVVYVEGTTGNIILWEASEEYPASYEVSFNGTVLEEDEWGGANIVYNVDGLEPGTYEYTLTVYDMSGNMATSAANVTVIPTVPVEPPLEVDWVLLIIIGAVAGGAIVAVIVIYYLRKKPGE